MDDETFDRIMSESSSEGTWVVLPLAKPPIDKGIADFLEKARKSFFENMSIPVCAKCWVEVELNDNGDIYCPECEMIIEVKGDE